MDTDKLEYFRNLLQHEIAELSIGQGKAITEMIVEAERLPDEIDHASRQLDRNFELRIRERERNLIAKVEEALLRINNGTYGICDDCGEDISEKRLIARPVTTFCINCKTKQEQAEKRGIARGPATRSNLKGSFQYRQGSVAEFDHAD